MMSVWIMQDIQSLPVTKMQEMDRTMQNGVQLCSASPAGSAHEAASTIYGPHTLSAYIQLFRVLAKAIAT